MMTADRIVIAVGAVVSFLLQVLLAPHIAIGFAFPNFMVAFCLAVAVARPGRYGPALPFLMGFAFDLVSGGPVGVMAFTLTAMSMLEAWAIRRIGYDTVFMAVAVLVGGVFLTELVFGLFLLLFGYAVSFPEALVFRVLPCFIYDLVISVVMFLAVSRLLGRGGGPLRTEITQL